MRRWIFLLLILFLFVGCQSVAKKQQAAVSRAVYATQESIKIGRFDLASKYSNETVRLIAPPKFRVQVNAFEVPIGTVQVGSRGGIFSKDELTQTTERYVVLPEGFENKPIIVDNSKQFDQLLEQHEVLRKAEAGNAKELAKVDKEIEKVIRAKEVELTKVKKTNWFLWLISGTGIITIIAIIIGCIAFPALIPIVMTIFSSIISGVGAAFTGFLKFFQRKDSG